MGASQEQIEDYFVFVPWDLDFRMSSPQTGFSALRRTRMANVGLSNLPRLRSPRMVR